MRTYSTANTLPCVTDLSNFGSLIVFIWNVILCSLTKLIFISNKCIFIFFWVHLVLNSHRIAPNFLKLDSWSPGAFFIPIISTKEISKIRKKRKIRKLQEKSVMHTKRFNTFVKDGCNSVWMQFHEYSFFCIFLRLPSK